MCSEKLVRVLALKARLKVEMHMHMLVDCTVPAVAYNEYNGKEEGRPDPLLEVSAAAHDMSRKLADSDNIVCWPALVAVHWLQVWCSAAAA